MKISKQAGHPVDPAITYDVQILTVTGGGAAREWADAEIAALGIDLDSRPDPLGAIEDRLSDAGYIVTYARHSTTAIDLEVTRTATEELHARTSRDVHLVTEDEARLLGAHYLSPAAEPRPGWYYLDADRIPRHAGAAEIGEDGARRVMARAGSTKSLRMPA